MTFIATVVLSSIIIGSILLVMMWARKPYYRIQRHNVVTLLKLVLSGEATENDWLVFGSTPLRHDPYLHALRERCMEIEEREYTGKGNSQYLFTPKGLDELQQILDELLATAGGEQ